PYATISAATSSQYQYATMTLASGTPQDGFYRAIFNMPTNATRGTWNIQVYGASDAASNHMEQMSSQFTITG
ncbi:hypothetical protein, partial [Nocardioides sp. MH1]|uniref:hypothetical protein n=1 Tax=Nocardioides sp. MH1 TaxID=3242490 RepID=UPI003521FD4F